MLHVGLHFLLLLCLAHSIPVDNGVEGDPEIECGPTYIQVNFNTRNPFEGHVFVKGRYAEASCRDDTAGGRVAGITLPFNSCGVKRLRSLEPRGVFVTTTVIISFHPLFITKVDRAYTLQCFYMEADKTVSTELEVSMLTTGFQTQTVPMPICRYEILDGSPTGPQIQYALVGQKVFHKWTCDTETSETFCMVVHSCYVDDGATDRVDLLDSDGCALDRYLLRNLEYDVTGLMANQETHVFKYADRPQLFFECQITITVREPNAACPVPQCSEPVRGKRSPVRPHVIGTLDVFTHIDPLDLDELSGEQKAPVLQQLMSNATAYTPEFCISTTAFALLLAALSMIFVTLSIVVGAFYLRQKRLE